MTATADTTTPTVVLNKPTNGTLTINSSTAITTDALTLAGLLEMSGNNIDLSQGDILDVNDITADRLLIVNAGAGGNPIIFSNQATQILDITGGVDVAGDITTSNGNITFLGTGALGMNQNDILNVGNLAIISDGTVGDPILRIGQDSDGFFRSAVNELSISLNNLQEYVFTTTAINLKNNSILETNVITFTNGGGGTDPSLFSASATLRRLDLTGFLKISDNGVVADPALMIGDELDGFYRSGTNQLSVSINNIQTVVFSAVDAVEFLGLISNRAGDSEIFFRNTNATGNVRLRVQASGNASGDAMTTYKDSVTSVSVGLDGGTDELVLSYAVDLSSPLIRIGASTTMAFFNATPIIQQTTTSQTAATFVANSSGISDDTATWNGYTIGDLVAILQAFGFIA